jgi:lipid-binding SYLF domain-containing protein
MIQRRTILLATGTVIVAGCSSSMGGTSDPAAKRREIDASVDNALAQLYGKAAGSRELADKARGILVMPKVVSAGFVIGGSYGQGALRKHGVTAGYYSVAAGSVGLLAGADSKAMYMLFMTDAALQKFESSNGWTAGADAQVTVINAGANASVDTATAQQPIIGYVLSNAGLMANLSLDGTKFSKIDL